MFRLRISTAILALYWLALFVGTHLPMRGARLKPFLSDKVVHFGGYFLLAALVAWSCIGWQRPAGRVFAAILLALVMYGAIDELTQQLVPTRTCDPLDWLADSAGATAGLLAYWLLVTAVPLVRGTAPTSEPPPIA